MSCSFENCKVRNEDRLLVCWMCDTLVHFQCAGFKGRDYDRIIDRSNGLRWSCSKCRTFDVNFHKLFSDAKAGFSDIIRDFSILNDKLKKVEDLFTNFDLSQLAGASPKRKKTSSRLDVEIYRSPVTPVSVESIRVGPTVEPGDIPSISITGVGDETTTPKISPITPVSSSDPGIGQIVEDTSVMTDSNCDLVVVPPRKTVFLSRFAPDTTVEALVKFIKNHSKGFDDSDFIVQKFKFSQPRDISSFKIIAPIKLFDILVDKSIWPDGALVREFIHRDRPRTNRVATLSKN